MPPRCAKPWAAYRPGGRRRPSGCSARWGSRPRGGCTAREIYREVLFGSIPLSRSERTPSARGAPMPDRTHYYHHHDLPRFSEIARGARELARKFFEWYGAVCSEGALSAREEALNAPAVARAVDCPYASDAYSSDALEKGSNPEQMP